MHHPGRIARILPLNRVLGLNHIVCGYCSRSACNVAGFGYSVRACNKNAERAVGARAVHVGVLLRGFDLVEYPVKHRLVGRGRVPHKGSGYLYQLRKALRLKLSAAKRNSCFFGRRRNFGCPFDVGRIGGERRVTKALRIADGADNVADLAHEHVVFKSGYQSVHKFNGGGQIARVGIRAEGLRGVAIRSYVALVAPQGAAKHIHDFVFGIVPLYIGHFSGSPLALKLLLFAGYACVNLVKFFFKPVIRCLVVRVHFLRVIAVHYLAQLGGYLRPLLHHLINFFCHFIPPKFLFSWP